MPTLTEKDTPFVKQSKTILAEATTRATALPANTVQVWPGGATFTTIQAAINSITGASAQEQYQVAVGPGTYNETVTMKDYIYIVGAGQDVTIITAPGQQNFASGTVNSASGAGISELTINATGGGWGTCPVGIKICGSGNFHISGVNINSSDGGQGGNNVRGISNNTGSYTGSIIIGSSMIQATGADGTTALGIEGFGNSSAGAYNLFIELTGINVQCQSGFGVSLAVAASATLEDSKISANVWALYNSDGASPITANQCTINGPVSPGVTVNN